MLYFFLSVSPLYHTRAVTTHLTIFSTAPGLFILVKSVTSWKRKFLLREVLLSVSYKDIRLQEVFVCLFVCSFVRSFFRSFDRGFFVCVCFVLFCFVLFCFVLFCFVLFCFVLFCFVLFCFLFFICVCVFVCLFVFCLFACLPACLVGCLLAGLFVYFVLGLLSEFSCCFSFSFSFCSKRHHSVQKHPVHAPPCLSAVFAGLPSKQCQWLAGRAQIVPECRQLPFSTLLQAISAVMLSCRPDVMPAVLTSLSACSFNLTPACPGQ